jgi:hypothetical protein
MEQVADHDCELGFGIDAPEDPENLRQRGERIGYKMSEFRLTVISKNDRSTRPTFGIIL